MVQIPCLNEEATLPATLRAIPRSIAGIERVEVLVIDDGSTDRTAEVARENGADHVLRFTGNRGLGHAFAAGIDRCLMLGADVIVNTDGDHQYDGGDIPALVEPILAGRADIVIGDRRVQSVASFSPLKRRLQVLGSRVVSRLAGMEVPDVASGFRAYSREAAMRLVHSTDFDHTVDHVIQAGRRRIVTEIVSIRTNEPLRESRLFSNLGVFVARSLGIMIRTYASYRALTIFSLAGLAAGALGFLLGLRFLYFYLFDPATRDLHVQSLILAAILLLAGFQMILTGIVADLVNSHRAISEDISYRLRRLELREQDKAKEKNDPEESKEGPSP